MNAAVALALPSKFTDHEPSPVKEMERAVAKRAGNGIRAALKTPVVTLEASSAGMRAGSKAPVPILAASSVGMSAAISNSPAIT
ncbi:hypothetical protein D3C75_1023580 [compost metagenome]